MTYDDSDWAHEMSDEPEPADLENGSSALDVPAPECLEEGPDCDGPVEYHLNPDRQDLKAFPCCRHHQDRRLRKAEETMRKYPAMQPHDFDSTYAGERWDED